MNATVSYDPRTIDMSNQNSEDLVTQMRKGGALMFRGWESERILSPQALKKACAKVKSWLKTGKKNDY